MLKFKQQSDFITSAKHFMHSSRAVLASFLNAVEEADLDKDTYSKALKHAEELGERLTALQKAVTTDYRNHAATLSAHKQFMQRWDDKISGMYMLVNRIAQSVREKDETGEHEELCLLADNIMERYKPHDEFAESSSEERQNRLDQAIAGGSLTYAKLASILRPGEFGSLASVRRHVNDAVASMLKRKYNEDTLRENSQRLMVHNVIELNIVEVLEQTYDEVFSTLSAVAKERLTSDDDDELTVPAFISGMIKTAVKKAFSLKVKHNALTDVNKIIRRHFEDLGVKTDYAFGN